MMSGMHDRQHAGGWDIHWDYSGTLVPPERRPPPLLTITTVRGSGHDMHGVKVLVVRDRDRPMHVSIYRPKAHFRADHVIVAEGSITP